MTTQTQQIAAKWAELFQAMADGKTIQTADCGYWYDLAGVSSFDLHKSPANYRVKPEEKTAGYRVALCKDLDKYYTTVIDHSTEIRCAEQSLLFVKWLTPWVEYTYEEQEQCRK